jgi:SAM-dependent methyltransferase
MSLLGREHFYPAFRNAIEDVARAGPVLDIGTDRKFRKELAPFRTLLSEKGYYALGYHVRRQGELTPDIDGDMQHLPFRTGSIGAVMAIEVFEHLPEPWLAADELRRILRPGGKAVITTPFQTGYHGSSGPHGYGDYFRYTEDGLRSLFSEFARIDVVPLGGKLNKLINTPPFQGLRTLALSPGLVRVFNALDRRMPTRSPTRWLVKLEN